MAKTKAKTGLSWKKKKWIPIVAPKLFRETIVGETFVEDPQSVIGKTLETNMMLLIGNIKKQNISVTLNIDAIKDNQAKTSIRNIFLQNASVKRLVRKRMTKIAESFACKTKDDLVIRIKPLILTRSKVNSKIEHSLRMAARNWVITFCNQNDYNTIVETCISLKIQRDLKAFLDKIYPMRGAQIRFIGLEPKAKSVITAKEEVKIESAPERPMRRKPPPRKKTIRKN